MLIIIALFMIKATYVYFIARKNFCVETTRTWHQHKLEPLDAKKYGCLVRG